MAQFLQVCQRSVTVLTPTTTCASGWTGTNCAVSTCDPATTCSGKGTCSSTGTCNCITGFVGANCGTCNPATLCNGHADGCSSVSGRCYCSSGWVGNSCELPVPKSYAYIYSEVNTDSAATIAAVLNSYGVKEAMYSFSGWQCGQDNSYCATHAAKIKALKAAGITVQLMMLADAAFIGNKNNWQPQIDGAAKFLSNYASDLTGAVTGLHWDMEVVQYPGWDSTDAHEKPIYDLWIDTHRQLSEYIRASPVLRNYKIATSVPWWQNEQTYAQADGYLAKMASYGYTLFIMSYPFNSPTLSTYVGRCDDEIAGVPTVIGLGRTDYASKAALANMAKQILDHYPVTSYRNFRGTCINSYTNLKADYLAGQSVSMPVVDAETNSDKGAELKRKLTHKLFTETEQ